MTPLLFNSAIRIVRPEVLQNPISTGFQTAYFQAQVVCPLRHETMVIKLKIFIPI